MPHHATRSVPVTHTFSAENTSLISSREGEEEGEEEVRWRQRAVMNSLVGIEVGMKALERGAIISPVPLWITH